MRFFYYLPLLLLILVPFSAYSQPLVQSDIEYLEKDRPDEDAYAYYDLRDRKTYVQITRSDITESPENPLCIHVQIFQQDKGCVELDFEDALTPNDTVIYDMDNIVRNNGTQVPINLDDDSYGFVTISSFECDNRNNEPGDLLGNFRIIDDAGYEYRVNLMTEKQQEVDITEDFPTDEVGIDSLSDTYSASIIIPFDTIDGATHSDIVGFVTEENRDISGNDDGPTADVIYNEEVGVTFDVFQLDENENRLSCGQKTIGCGPNVVMNYGINNDYPPSRGENVLCDGGGLLEGQTNGYISLENATMLSPLDDRESPEDTSFEFACLVGLNNGNGTGSMDMCQVRCNNADSDNDCDPLPPG